LVGQGGKIERNVWTGRGGNCGRDVCRENHTKNMVASKKRGIDTLIRATVRRLEGIAHVPRNQGHVSEGNLDAAWRSKRLVKRGKTSVYRKKRGLGEVPYAAKRTGAFPVQGEKSASEDEYVALFGLEGVVRQPVKTKGNEEVPQGLAENTYFHTRMLGKKILGDLAGQGRHGLTLRRETDKAGHYDGKRTALNEKWSLRSTQKSRVNARQRQIVSGKKHSRETKEGGPGSIWFVQKTRSQI